MTTIVCDRKVMAADSLMIDNGMRSRGTKLFRVGNEIIGLAGNYYAAMAFLRWYIAGCEESKEPQLENGNVFEAIVLSPDGTMTQWTEAFEPCELEDDFWAIGSGAAAALGAMHAGATPKEAVEIACKVDAGSGLPAVEMRP